MAKKGDNEQAFGFASLDVGQWDKFVEHRLAKRIPFLFLFLFVLGGVNEMDTLCALVLLLCVQCV